MDAKTRKYGRFSRRISTLSITTLGVLLTGLLMAEATVRIFAPRPVTVHSEGLFEPDPPRRFRLTPGHNGFLSNIIEFETSISINTLGLRGPELAEKKNSSRRILVIGDSFAFGWGVEQDETFVALLGQELQDTETVNAGVPGFSVVDEVDWFERYGLEQQPDLVLLAVCLANDILDATEARRKERISNVAGAGPNKGFTSWLYKNSHLMRWAVWAPPANLRTFLGLPEPWVVTLAKDMIKTNSDDPSSVLVKQGRQATEAALARLSQLSAEHDFSIAAVLIPAEYQIQEDFWKAILPHFGLSPDDYDPEIPGRFFAEALARHGIPTLEVAPLLRQAQLNGETVYFKADGHWTLAGHRLASLALQDFFIEQDLLRPRPTPSPRGIQSAGPDEVQP